MTDEGPTVFDRLSPEDRARAAQDFVIFGQCIVYEKDDGTVELLDPMAVHIACERSSTLRPVADALPGDGGEK